MSEQKDKPGEQSTNKPKMMTEEEFGKRLTKIVHELRFTNINYTMKRSWGHASQGLQPRFDLTIEGGGPAKALELYAMIEELVIAFAKVYEPLDKMG